VVLVSLELSARVYRLFVDPPTAGYGYPPGLFSWDPDCEYRCTPGFRGFFVGGLYEGVPIRINRDGYRDEEFEPERRAGLYRVAFLGDSVTFGAGVPVERRFSDLLRGADGPGGTVETQNFAVNAYTAWHYAQQARAVLPRYAPDAVVVGLCLNDLEGKEHSWPRKHVAAPDGSFVGDYLNPQRRQWRPRDVSAFWNVLWELERRWKNRDPWRRRMRKLGAEWEDPTLREGLRAHLLAIRDAVAPRPLVVLLLPEAHDVSDPERFGLPRREARALLEASGLPYLDPFDDFRADPEPLSLFLENDSIHFSPPGHERIAARLREWLASLPR
jgi:lysophospholipase L1-like esterase